MGKNKKIGIMLGRLTPPKGRGIQFFPFENWKNEFVEASKIGLNEIEFIFDFPNWRKNPLMTDSGQKEIIKLSKENGIEITSICADYFMRKPLFGPTSKSSSKILNILIEVASKTGISLIEIPLVDNSSLKNKLDIDSFVITFSNSLKLATSTKIKFGLETDLTASQILSLLKKINSTIVMVNYDTGNSASLGHDLAKEITVLENKIINVHIKDRLYKGGTVPLGHGDVNFDSVFESLKKINYNNGFILQAARGSNGKELETIKNQKEFLLKYINKYLN